MIRMTGPDHAVMCNLINTHIHTHLMQDCRWGTRLNAMLWGLLLSNSQCVSNQTFRHYTYNVPVQKKSSGSSEGRATSIRTLE